MSAPGDGWAALALPPWAFVRTSWPWRSVGYLVTSVVIGPVVGVVFGATVVLGAVTSLLVVGLAILATLPRMAAVLAVVERRRLGLLRDRPGFAGRVPEQLRFGQARGTSWPEMGYAALLGGVLWVVDLLILVVAAALPVTLLLVPWLVDRGTVTVLAWQVDTPSQAWAVAAIGVVTLVAMLYVVTFVAQGQALVADRLLAPGERQLEVALAAVHQSRVDLVDAFAVERGRIERDLHDGVQQRLVALTMTLGRAELDLTHGPALSAVHQAQEQAQAALRDLRATIRGIHPQVLTDYGLAAAVQELADHAPLPVTVEIDGAAALAPATGEAAYFVVSEALTNVVRHAQAAQVLVRGHRDRGGYLLLVRDDGIGGACVDSAGSGLAGLRVRLDALGGTLSVSSPPGGPTEVRMWAPCPR